MNDTSGLFGFPSYSSYILQSCLASRFQRLLDTAGTTRLQLTLRVKTTPLQRLYYQLLPVMHGMSGKDYGLLPTPTGTSNHGMNNTVGRLDEWGKSNNPFRGTDLGKLHCPSFELWIMGYPEEWQQQMPSETLSSHKLRLSSWNKQFKEQKNV